MRGDELFAPMLHRWAKCNKSQTPITGETKGHDLWHNSPPNIEWKSIIGSMMSINMQGWGEPHQRNLPWQMLARTKTLAAVIIDHRQYNHSNVEMEMVDRWTGVGNGKEASFGHVKPTSKQAGGITIALHPILGRYRERHKSDFDDPRGWNRWAQITLRGREKLLILGVYGPTGGGSQPNDNTMWGIQQQAMANIPTIHKQKNPKYQFMYDLGECIRKAKSRGYDVIVMGDTNVALQTNSMEEQFMLETMEAYEMHTAHKIMGPNQGQVYTFPRYKTWIDHIWVSKSLMSRGAIQKVGIDYSRTDYTSDHHMIGMRVHCVNMLGKIQPMKSRYQQRRRIVRCAIPKSKIEYREIAERRWETVGKVLGMQAYRMKRRALAIGRTGTERQRRKLGKTMNKFS